jgi:7,8-dihydro-6-hydroxymethylpterin-pyrophosphokinase
VLVPLAEIAPDLVHPVLCRPIQKLLENVDRSEIYLFKGK